MGALLPGLLHGADGNQNTEFLLLLYSREVPEAARKASNSLTHF